ncbi:MAG TPA: DUF3618 domain-containing protein [Actinocrinis sp.]|jgi:hypothetical protein
MPGRKSTAQAERRGGEGKWTVPGPIDEQEARKGTAAANPVLVATPSGVVADSGPVDEVIARQTQQAPRDTRSPAEIEAEIDQTRTHLSDTLDELTERLSPANLARLGGRSAKAQFVDPETGKLKRSRTAAVAGSATAAVGGLAAFKWLRRGRREA